MSPEEVINLLTLAAAYDHRTTSDIDVDTWLDAAHRERWTYYHAQEAIRAHYARYAPMEKWLTVAHITQGIAAIRRDEQHQPPPALEPPPEATEQRDHAKAHIRATLAKRGTK